MFLSIDESNPKAVYRQIVDGIRAQIASEQLQPGDSLPSVRELSRYLDVNVNTVNKAYQELKQMKIIITRPARGAIVSPDALNMLGSDEHKIRLQGELDRLLREAHRLGFTREDVVSLLQQMDNIQHQKDVT